MLQSVAVLVATWVVVSRFESAPPAVRTVSRSVPVPAVAVSANMVHDCCGCSSCILQLMPVMLVVLQSNNYRRGTTWWGFTDGIKQRKLTKIVS